MKRKVVIVAAILWIISVIGGGAWGRFEQYLRTRSIPAGQIEVQNLKDLYDANLYDETLGECSRAEGNPQYAAYLPQVMYIEWATDRRLSRLDEAGRVQRNFLQQFPDHVLAANMHFSTAMNLLATADYKASAVELETIRTRFPGSSIASKAADILQGLQNSAPMMATTNP